MRWRHVRQQRAASRPRRRAPCIEPNRRACRPAVAATVRRLPMLPAYAELHCRSNFSFLTGASHPEELVQRAHELGYAALAITDECSLAGVVRAHAQARRVGLHLIVGTEMHLAAAAPATGAKKAEATETPDMRLVLLATTRRGYGN